MTNLLTLNWIQPHPLVRHVPGTEYALDHDGRYVYERVRDADGSYHYRRAEWRAIAPSMTWLDVPAELWLSIEETGPETIRSTSPAKA